jgi:hypothetical protein
VDRRRVRFSPPGGLAFRRNRRRNADEYPVAVSL